MEMKTGKYFLKDDLLWGLKDQYMKMLAGFHDSKWMDHRDVQEAFTKLMTRDVQRCEPL